MRQLSIIFLFIFILITGSFSPAFSAIKGKLEYTIPVDYSKINEQETTRVAREYYFNAEKSQDGVLNDDMTNALVLYGILQRVNPENIEYPIRLGVLYDKIGKDRQAKGNFSKAIGINCENPAPYFHFGNFYYKRESYRKALKYYNESYKKGLKTDYELLSKMGDIYEKFGDSRSALKYLKEAQVQNPTPELENKIKQVEMQDSINKEYYSDTRIRG